MVLSLKKQNKKDNAQSERFKESARQLGCDEDEDRFNATLKKIMTAETKKDEKHSKD